MDEEVRKQVEEMSRASAVAFWDEVPLGVLVLQRFDELLLLGLRLVEAVPDLAEEIGEVPEKTALERLGFLHVDDVRQPRRAIAVEQAWLEWFGQKVADREALLDALSLLRDAPGYSCRGATKAAHKLLKAASLCGVLYAEDILPLLDWAERRRDPNTPPLVQSWQSVLESWREKHGPSPLETVEGWWFDSLEEIPDEKPKSDPNGRLALFRGEAFVGGFPALDMRSETSCLCGQEPLNVYGHLLRLKQGGHPYFVMFKDGRRDVLRVEDYRTESRRWVSSILGAMAEQTMHGDLDAIVLVCLDVARGAPETQEPKSE